MMNGNILLIGMPRAGKSTTGVVLAKALCMQFVDTDLMIMEREKRALQEILCQKCLKGFLEIEEKSLLTLNIKNHVVATGGSVVYSHSSIMHLRKEDGKVFYLSLQFEEIRSRIYDMTTRGIAKSPEQSLYDLYQERSPLCKKAADQVIECTGQSMEQIIEVLVAAITRPAV